MWWRRRMKLIFYSYFWWFFSVLLSFHCRFHSGLVFAASADGLPNNYSVCCCLLCKQSLSTAWPYSFLVSLMVMNSNLVLIYFSFLSTLSSLYEAICKARFECYECFLLYSKLLWSSCFCSFNHNYFQRRIYFSRIPFMVSLGHRHGY